MVLKRDGLVQEEGEGPIYTQPLQQKKSYMAEVSSEGGKVDISYFDTIQEAQLWLKDHGERAVCERKLINWTFPIDRKVPLPTWVKIG